MPPKEQIAPESAKAHLARSLKLAEESKQVGVATLIKLDEQTEQLRRVQVDAEDTEHIIKGNRGVVKDMRRNWLIRLCCYNRTDILPDDVTWDRRDTPEEQARVKKMIKLDRRRRQLRRMTKKKDGTPGAEGEDEQAKTQAKSSWKFWKSNNGSDDSDLSDISEDSGEDEGANKAAILPKRPVPKIVASNVVSSPDDLLAFPDEDTALDHLENTVQDLKIIAMQISETSTQQTALMGGISNQVNRNQEHLERNNKLIGKLGRRAKEDGDDGVLNAQDKLAIMGVKSAFNAKFNS